MIPGWLHAVSIASLCICFAFAAFIAADEIRRPQHMWIMNVVWPLTALFGGPWIVWHYFRYGRAHSNHAGHMRMDGKKAQGADLPFPAAVANAALHCGSGCTLGDIVAEWLMFAFPAIAIAFGWHSLFEDKMYAAWIVDYLAAYAFGILFQFYTIAPMRNLSVRAGLVAAVKADTFSLTAWQVGMYGFMAFASLAIFRGHFGAELTTNSFEFWFMMQIAMICGFITSYPVNWWLIRAGIKERM
jgi:hypothetical protein